MRGSIDSIRHNFIKKLSKPPAVEASALPAESLHQHRISRGAGVGGGIKRRVYARMRLLDLKVFEQPIQCNVQFQIILVSLGSNRGADAADLSSPDILRLTQSAQHL